MTDQRFETLEARTAHLQEQVEALWERVGALGRSGGRRCRDCTHFDSHRPKSGRTDSNAVYQGECRHPAADAAVSEASAACPRFQERRASAMPWPSWELTRNRLDRAQRTAGELLPALNVLAHCTEDGEPCLRALQFFGPWWAVAPPSGGVSSLSRETGEYLAPGGTRGRVLQLIDIDPRSALRDLLDGPPVSQPPELVSEVCRRTSVQACHLCEDMTCGDNTTPAARECRGRRHG